MVIAFSKLSRSFRYVQPSFLNLSFIHSVPPAHLIEESVRAAVESKAYHKIPDLLKDPKEILQHSNPFTFLSAFSQELRTQIVDEILQRFLPIRPRSLPQSAYSFLLSYTLQNPNPLALSLAILQRTLCSGCVPIPQAQLLLSHAWIEQRKQSQRASSILVEMQSIGYPPDTGTCNFIISSLCKFDQYEEAIHVLKSMAEAACFPDLDSFGSILYQMCVTGRTDDLPALLKEMVNKFQLTPRQGLVVKIIKAMRSDKEIRGAVEMIEFLESKGIPVGFQSYELVLQGCIQSGQLVLAGKLLLEMTKRGFIPHFKVRQKLLQRLAVAGEWELACAVRNELTKLKS